MDDIEQMLQIFGSADLYLFGDGSGSVVDKPCASVCVYYDKRLKKFGLLESIYNYGTNNFAELMPYIHALWLYEYRYNIASRSEFRHFNTNIEIISDSEVTVKQGNGEYNRAHGPNAMLWMAIEWFSNNGYKLHWNHVSRNSNTFNALCDKLAGELRKMMLTRTDKQDTILKELVIGPNKS